MLREQGVGAAVRKKDIIPDFVEITESAPISIETHGWKAKCLQRLIRLHLPVPRSVTLSADMIRAIRAGRAIDATALLTPFGVAPLVSVRASPADPAWGGPATILNVGMNASRHGELARRNGADIADALYVRFIQDFATDIRRLDPDIFDSCKSTDLSPDGALTIFEREAGESFPQDPERQLREVLDGMARAWGGTSARLLRAAKGAPEDAALGLIVQEMAQDAGPGVSGAGVICLVDGESGEPHVSGWFTPAAHALMQARGGTDAARSDDDPDEESLDGLSPELIAALKRHGAICRRGLREEMQIEFAVESGKLAILDATRVPRSARGELKIAVALARDNVISRREAVLRVEPDTLSHMLHPQIDMRQQVDVFAHGLAASPGAATGRLVFSATVAEERAARGENCVLIRRETGPEDIRGMHSSVGVLTGRGGMTSHAAVIARGLGLPCVVGTSDLRLDLRARCAISADGRVFHEGDVVTVDGTRGQIAAGAAPLLYQDPDDSLIELLSWADEFRDIGVRANADTPADAIAARDFAAEGIGLCRTEHMFFDDTRLLVMRRMIFADGAAERDAALAELHVMQREDFSRIFAIMSGQPVCVRLFDPPLHEFLPRTHKGLEDLAQALEKPLSEIRRRAEALENVNPMLGMRGVRVGVALPEIYEMQARAIFEAAIECAANGTPVVPEVMIPLVSTAREVAVIRARIEAVAARVRAVAPFEYRLGVMVETPRAALLAGEIAHEAEFMSFGTNDLTQMTYGLSRDDAGSFMGAYLRQAVFPNDPFRVLDIDGVGELLRIGADRGRRARPELTLGLCGEHGGNPESIAFCRQTGFDYVSCSPYRVPVARLVAAQIAIRESLCDCDK